jgi:hypothetical protein
LTGFDGISNYPTGSKKVRDCFMVDKNHSAAGGVLTKVDARRVVS